MAAQTMLQKVLRAVAGAGVWKATGKLHTMAYRASGGRLGFSAGPITHLLLTTTGRKSGVARTVPLSFLPDADRFVVVASNGGGDRDPAWWTNLRANPRASVQVRDRTVAVTAREATPDEHARLWPELKRVNPFYAQYEQITARRIPVVVLVPVG